MIKPKNFIKTNAILNAPGINKVNMNQFEKEKLYYEINQLSDLLIKHYDLIAAIDTATIYLKSIDDYFENGVINIDIVTSYSNLHNKFYHSKIDTRCNFM